MVNFDILTMLGAMSLSVVELAMWAVLAFVMGVFVLSFAGKTVLGSDKGLFTAGITMILSVVAGLVLIVLLDPLGIQFLGAIAALVVTVFIVQYMYDTSITNAFGTTLIFFGIMAVMSWALAQIFLMGIAVMAASDATMATVWQWIMIFATGAIAVWGSMEVFKRCTGACRTKPIARLSGR